ncbi:hypothetical protein ACFSTD_11180 [Novosphingobium colocasiae]
MKESIAITSCLFLATALFGGRRAPRRNQVTIIVRFRDWRTNSEKKREHLAKVPAGKEPACPPRISFRGGAEMVDEG